MGKKIFVLDTNVILHDYNCIYSFENNDIAIPITVLEEIDQFKKGNNQINFNAREFIRILDSLSGEKLMNSGAKISPERGKIFIITNHQFEKRVKQVFAENKPDHRILSVSLFLTKNNEKKRIVLVSKDVNLRLKAKSLGIIAQDYHSDRIKDIDKLYSGKEIIMDFPTSLIDKLYEPDGFIHSKDLNLPKLYPNQYFILKNKQKSALAYYNAEEEIIKRVPVKRAYGIKPRNAEQTFAIHGLTNNNIFLMTMSGKAGTGKTLLALASALEERKKYRQIYLARPIIPLSNRDLGYLPGGIEEKLDPYMQPLYDNLSVIKSQFKETTYNAKRIDEMLENQKLCISPLAYIRGRNLDRIFFIVDEAQNLTPHEVKTIITRAGENTKIIFTGDPYQIDTPYLDSRSNGLTYLIDRMKGQSLYAHINLIKGERSTLAEIASDLL